MDGSYTHGAGHDPDAVRFFDVAHEGAQLRAVASAVGHLAPLQGADVRSVVVLATDHISLAAAQAAVSALAPLEVPVMVARTLPGFVGPLDVVVVLGAEAGRDEDSRALINAAQRGASTVLAGPREGPLLDDAPSATITIPALPTAMGASPARAAAVTAAVLRVLARPVEVVAERLELLADEVDAEVESLAPDRDETVNAARQLRLYAQGARVVHAGAGAFGDSVAQVAAALWTSRGLASGYLPADELAGALQAAREAAPAAAAADDIFHDPYLDGPPQLVGLKPIVWACGDAYGLLAPDARVETVGEGVGSSDAAAQALRLTTRAYAAAALTEPGE